MLRLMTEMMKLPITLFVSGMEVFVRAMREYQHIASRALDATVEEIRAGDARAGGTKAKAVSPSAPDTGCATETSATNAENPQEKESDVMIDDAALGSKDTKTVRYRIIFTKRHLETTLKEAEATVNYVTDQGSLGGRYISDFWTAAGLGKERDALKRLYKVGYRGALRTRAPKGKSQKITEEMADDEKKYPNLGWTIPEDDKRYLTFKAELLDQLPRQEGEYERQKADELRQIREILGERLKKEK
jgi:hypothetical protein